MGTTMESMVAAFMGADDERKAAALRVLRGERPVGGEQSAVGSGGKEVEPYVSLREVARRLGISTCSLWRYGVPGHSFAGRARYRMSEVEEHLRKLEAGSKEQGARRSTGARECGKSEPRKARKARKGREGS